MWHRKTESKINTYFVSYTVKKSPSAPNLVKMLLHVIAHMRINNLELEVLKLNLHNAKYRRT
jgi:hypothetical protein